MQVQLLNTTVGDDGRMFCRHCGLAMDVRGGCGECKPHKRGLKATECQTDVLTWRPTFTRRVASTVLRAVERLYLALHGWSRLDDGEYLPPTDWPLVRKHASYHRRHAVNAQHQVYAEVTKARGRAS